MFAHCLNTQPYRLGLSKWVKAEEEFRIQLEMGEKSLRHLHDFDQDVRLYVDSYGLEFVKNLFEEKYDDIVLVDTNHYNPFFFAQIKMDALRYSKCQDVLVDLDLFINKEEAIDVINGNENVFTCVEDKQKEYINILNYYYKNGLIANPNIPIYNCGLLKISDKYKIFDKYINFKMLIYNKLKEFINKNKIPMANIPDLICEQYLISDIVENPVVLPDVSFIHLIADKKYKI